MIEKPAPAVIEIASVAKLPSGVQLFAYVCEPSADSAIELFQQRFGYLPAKVYRWQDAAGRVTIYCELKENEDKNNQTTLPEMQP